MIIVPLEPAMKPRIRAFSGLVTLLAVLNISWAAYIWSLCGAQCESSVVSVCTVCVSELLQHKSSSLGVSGLSLP